MYLSVRRKVFKDRDRCTMMDGDALVVIGIFAYMVILMWIVSKVFGNKLVAEDQRSGMIMELPPYHKAHWGHILKEVWLKCRDMFRESHSLKWTVRTAAFYVGAALILSCIVYHVSALLIS